MEQVHSPSAERASSRVVPSSDPEEEPIASWKVELSGGALCSLMVCVAFYPLESVEARMQVGQLAAARSGTARRSLAGLVASVGRAEGARGLYRGVVPTATGTIVNGGLYFALYDHLRSRFHRTFASPAPGTAEVQSLPHKRRPAMGIDLMAAAMSGVVCTLVVNPFWVLKLHRITAAAANSAHSPSLLASVRHVVGTQGYRGLWRGTVISLLGVADGAIQFATYDQLKYWLSDERGVLPVWAQLLSGASSRAVALMTTYPYQLLRSVLQQQNCPYRGLLDATRHIVNAEGLRGLYKGIGLNLTRSLPPAACFWFIIEQFRLALK